MTCISPAISASTALQASITAKWGCLDTTFSSISIIAEGVCIAGITAASRDASSNSSEKPTSAPDTFNAFKRERRAFTSFLNPNATTTKAAGQATAPIACTKNNFQPMSSIRTSKCSSNTERGYLNSTQAAIGDRPANGSTVRKLTKRDMPANATHHPIGFSRVICFQTGVITRVAKGISSTPITNPSNPSITAVTAHFTKPCPASMPEATLVASSLIHL